MGAGLIITFVVVSIGFAVCLLGSLGYAYVDFLDYLAAGFFGMLAGLLAVCIVLIPGFFLPTHSVDPVKTEVSSLKDTSESSGRFVLGSGTASAEPYFYYAVEKDGFTTINKAEILSSKIREGSYEKPYVLTYDVQFKSAIARFFYGKSTGKNTYEFYLPEDTITTDYKIDME